MARLNTFTFRIDEVERSMIVALADRLHRTQSDAIRRLIYESARELGIDRETEDERRREHIAHYAHSPLTPDKSATEASTLIGDVHASG